MKTKKTSWITSVLMIPLACVVGLPFYFILVNTFKTQAEAAASPLALPSSLYLDNYVNIFKTIPLLQGFLNTLCVTAFSVALMLIIGSLAAFGMIMRNTRLNRLFGVLLLVGFIVPFQTTLIPLYELLVNVKLVDTLTGLIALYSAGAIFCYFLIQGYMRTVPMEIIEAARIDGAGLFRIYGQIVLPLIRPILVTVGVFETMWVWNDFITPNVFISSPQNQTLVLQVYSAVRQFTIDWPAFMTMTVIVLIPMLIFFIFMQRHIVSGLVNGSVKG
ncbi:carbohydrate ABC transporter permease [Subtercola endophyticus]|uniref:carbohydrate ABC transporter permease n=1 Tax=Subtercola endophyticus TaxID=2895559 RepID=UPI001E32C1E1|nr:carbohydrate ABC transporter permease [Subtercola endophyticus]UFS59937.1 carbohydrate ABC transporter permease [Subtercola endophyticus]